MTATVEYQEQNFDNGAVTLPGPRPGFEDRAERVRNVTELAGGELRITDRGVKTLTRVMEVEVSVDERDSFDGWFDTNPAKEFTFVDHLGVEYSDCKIMDVSRWEKTAGQRFVSQMTLRLGDEVEVS